MSDKEIVEKFFKKGKLLTPSALEQIKQGFSVIDSEKLIIDANDFEKKARVIKNLSFKPKEATTEDFIKFYKSKYEKMKSILASRLQKNFLSFNKIPPFRKEVFLIGIVKEIQGKTIELEDITGNIKVIFDEKFEVELDDAIAVRGISEGKIVHGKEIFFPDIPLRQPKKGNGLVCFLSGNPDEKLFKKISSEKIDYIFVAGKLDAEKFEKLVDEFCENKKFFVSEQKESYPSTASFFSSKNIIPLSDPAIVEISGVKILNISNFNLKMLKKRYLGKTKTILPEDYLVLDIVPDIVNFASEKQSITNYKSVTVISSKEPLIIDLSTREISNL